MRNYDTKVYDYIDKATGAHVVKATTMYAGKQVSAVSKCDPEDVFDLKFGTDVALKRLDIKIALKRAASTREHTKFCQMNLELIENEKRRVSKSLERAKVAEADRRVEANELKKQLAELLASIN
jgi:hypothetical protein